MRWVVFVLDCLAPHDFSVTQTRDLMNLQHYVIRENELSKKQSLVVNQLYCAKIVHRDLKLGNIILEKSSNEVTITNFCLG